jgi:hypothetical protein
MVDYVFVRENTYLPENSDLEKPYECIFFQLEIPNFDIEPIQLTGSKIIVSKFLGDVSDNCIKNANIGTVTDVLRRNGYRDDLRLGEHANNIKTVFARIRPDVFYDLVPFSFDSEYPNDEGWFNNFSVHRGKGEASAVIPIKNIEGYIVPNDIVENPLCNYWRIGWPPTEACLEYLKRQHAEGEVTRSDDLLTVSTIVKRNASPFSEDDVVRESQRYGKPLNQIEIGDGLSEKYGLVDEVRF